MAKRFFRTQTADRPDLAAIGSTSQLDVKGYIFPKIFPLMPVTEKSGTMSVAPAGLTNAQGVEGRTNGTELTGGNIEMVDVNWSAVRIEGRSKMYETEASAYSSEAAADNAGAEDAQRRAWNTVEKKACDKIFTTTRKSGATTLADHAVIKTIQKTAKKLRKYGKPTLVMTTNTWFDFVEIPEVRHRLEKLAGAGNDVGYIMTDLEKVRSAVSTFLSIEGIEVFDSEIVDTSAALDGFIAVVALRSNIAGRVLESAKEKAIYGFAPVYIPENAPADKPFDMRSFYDNAAKCNVYDAEAFLNVVEAHSGAVAMTKMAASYTEYAVPVVNVETAAQTEA